MEGALLLTDLLPAWPCACSAGSGSGRCGAIDSEVPGATREIQRRNNQEEGCPSVDAVREAHEARGGLDSATGKMRDLNAAEVAVRHWADQAPHAGAPMPCPHLRPIVLDWRSATFSHPFARRSTRASDRRARCVVRTPRSCAPGPTVVKHDSGPPRGRTASLHASRLAPPLHPC